MLQVGLVLYSYKGLADWHLGGKHCLCVVTDRGTLSCAANSVLSTLPPALGACLQLAACGCACGCNPSLPPSLVPWHALPSFCLSS
jgi:hypothetical protein